MRKGFLSFALVVALLLGTVSGVLAWTYFGKFYGSNWWAPNEGEKWGQMLRDYSGRYLDADADNVWWDGNRAIQLNSQGNDPQTVFHIFKPDSNCGERFNFTGYWWANIAGVYKYHKWADCVFWTSGPDNELRIYYPRFNIVAYQLYDVGGRFQDQSGSSPAGEVTYDTYFSSNKEYHTKWCFESDDSLHNPNDQGRCH